jgi:hypothetical protein
MLHPSVTFESHSDWKGKLLIARFRILATTVSVSISTFQYILLCNNVSFVIK